MKQRCYSDGKVLSLATKNPLKCTFQGGQYSRRGAWTPSRKMGQPSSHIYVPQALIMI